MGRMSEGIPLALESESFDALVERVKVAAPEILEANHKSATNFQLRFIPEGFVAVG